MRSKPPRIVATFVGQAWIRDYAHEIDDGRTTFDCTRAILRMPAARIAEMSDDDYCSDALVPEKILREHRGPFRVEVEDAILGFFKELGFESITPPAVREARRRMRSRRRPQGAAR